MNVSQLLNPQSRDALPAAQESNGGTMGPRAQPKTRTAQPDAPGPSSDLYVPLVQNTVTPATPTVAPSAEEATHLDAEEQAALTGLLELQHVRISQTTRVTATRSSQTARATATADAPHGPTAASSAATARARRVAPLPSRGEMLSETQKQRLRRIATALATVATLSGASVLVAEAVLTLRASEPVLTAPIQGPAVPQGSSYQLYREPRQTNVPAERHVDDPNACR